MLKSLCTIMCYKVVEFAIEKYVHNHPTSNALVVTNGSRRIPQFLSVLMNILHMSKSMIKSLTTLLM